MKKIIWSLSVVVLLFSCNSNEPNVDLDVKEGEKRSKLAAGSESEEDLKAAAAKRRKEQEKLEKERRASQTFTTLVLSKKNPL